LTYAITTFITPSPIEIPIDIWSRYLLYLPGSIMAGIDFLRLWREQKLVGFNDVANLMLGAGLAFLFEALVLELVVPAVPYGPASYYNYDHDLFNAFTSGSANSIPPTMLYSWLDYTSILALIGLPIEFWRLISTFAVTFFVVRGLDAFDSVQQREMKKLQFECDLAQQRTFEPRSLRGNQRNNGSTRS